VSTSPPQRTREGAAATARPGHAEPHAPYHSPCTAGTMTFTTVWNGVALSQRRSAPEQGTTQSVCKRR
jgi:hypothetical protein